MFLLASIAIPLFYASGLMYGQRSNLVTAEYWRWWVVHLWVEGFFEVFATSVIALLFTRLGLIRVASATGAVIMTAVIYLSGGIIGTFHHLYFTGTPTGVLALGATFSALEVVPLILVGFEAHENWHLSRVKKWLEAYRWPLAYLLAVAFWNLLGAGVFGFLINTPIALYYMQGLNTTPLHGHTALFGVYGNLGIGLTLFCLKAFSPRVDWQTKMLGFSFWAINIGLLMMAVLSLLPVGMLQTFASVEHGMWFARSAEFMQQPVVNVFRWLRVPGDSIFALGALALAWFVFTLPFRKNESTVSTAAPAATALLGGQ
jgi:nitric oxide reductase subunit B